MSANEDQTARPRGGLIKRFIGVFGVQYTQDKGHWMLLTRRFRRIILGLIVLVVAALGSFFFYFSSSPGFCKSCHIMDTYVASWQGSKHKDVRCDKCHYAPGWRNVVRAKVAATSQIIQTITGTEGSKLHAEVEDAACLRGGCHETRLLKGKVTFKGKYLFDHTTHLSTTKLRRGKKLRCTSCHSQIVQGSHITVTESVCFTCHFKGHIQERLLDPIASMSPWALWPGPWQVAQLLSSLRIGGGRSPWRISL